jgi:hypothetical protein
MNYPPGAKKRENTRLRSRHAAYRDLSIIFEGWSEDIPVRVPDVSPQGMFINTSRYFPEGSVIKVRFRLTRSRYEVSARGEVRYCLPGVGIGLEFVEISPQAQRAIEEDFVATDALPSRST